LPLVVGAGVAGRANLPVVLLCMSVVLVFLARTPAEMAFRRSDQRIVNAAWAMLFASIAVAAIVALLAYYDRWLLIPLGIPVIIGPVAVVSSKTFRVSQRELGELIVVVSFAALARATHYASIGNLEATGLSLWLLSALYGGSSIFYVRMLLGGGRPPGNDARPDRRSAVRIYHIALVALVTLIILVGGAPPLVAVAFVPLLAKVIYRTLKLPDSLNIQKTGLFEASQAILFAILVIVAYAVS
jgi:hypothetical protein